MFKRMLCLILAVVMALAAAACGDSDETEPTAASAGNTEATDATSATGDETRPTEPVTPATSDETEPTQPDEKEGLDMKAFLKDFDRTAQIEEQVVYDVDNVKVTALKLRYDPVLGAVVQFRVENKSEQNLLIQTEACAVNDYMMKTDLSIAAAAGKTAEGEMIVSYPSLALAGCQKIAVLEYTLLLIDSSTFDVLTTCEPVVMQTTAFGKYEQTYDDEGQTAYDDGSIRIVLKSIDRSRQVSEYPCLIVYMYNGSDRTREIQEKALWINGYEITRGMSTTVMPSKHAVDVVEFYDMDLQEHNIGEFDSVEVSFRIVDDETWDTVAETELVLLEEE